MATESWTDDILAADFVRLTTFRGNGDAVGTPVWFVVDGDALLVTTMESTGKVKRIRRTDRVSVCASDRRGHAQGPDVEGRAELLPGRAATDIRERVTTRYGFQGKLLAGITHAVSRLKRGPAPVPIGIRLLRVEAEPA